MKAFHFDFNTAFFRIDYLKEFIQKLHIWGYDTIIWELENYVLWDSVPGIGEKDSVSKSQFQELLTFAESLKMDNIPLLQCLGHCEYVLQSPAYSELADTPEKWGPYCPSNVKTREFLRRWIEEYLEIFANSTFFHLGCDEVWHLGVSCPECKKRIAGGEKAALMSSHINFLAAIIRNAKKTPVIWADMLLIYPEMAELLAKDIVMVDWRYELRSDCQKLWLWDDKGGYLIDENNITDNMRKYFGKYLYCDGKVNIHYTTDFLKAHGFKVICAGASSCYPDNFLLGNAENHLYNSCTMMKKGMENFGYLHTSWTVHLFFYELQMAIEMADNIANCRDLTDKYTLKYFGIEGKEFFEALNLLAPRVLFSGAESTGCGKAVKSAAPDIIRTKLHELHNNGILESELTKTIQYSKDFNTAVNKLHKLRKSVKFGKELFDLYILAAEALLNRADFGILAASEFLGRTHSINRKKVKTELLRLQELYLIEYMHRQTPEHAERIIHTIFGTLLEYLTITEQSY